jgi:hypothetical protein
MKEALSSPETSVLTRAIWRSIPEDAIVHRWRLVDERSDSHCRGGSVDPRRELDAVWSRNLLPQGNPLNV